MFGEKPFNRWQVYPLVQLHLFEHSREGHLSEFVMMPVTLSVGRRHKQAVLALRRGAHGGVFEKVAVVQQPAEGDALRQSGVIENYRDRAAGGQFTAVRARDVEVRPSRGQYGAAVDDHRLALVRGEYRKLHAAGRKRLQRGNIDGRLRQPHALWRAPETVFEILGSPDRLRQPVTLRGERHYYMVVGLGDRP